MALYLFLRVQSREKQPVLNTRNWSSDSLSELFTLECDVSCPKIKVGSSTENVDFISATFQRRS